MQRAKPRILIIDDQKYVRLDLIEELLSNGDNFVIETASSSMEGLEKVEQFSPNLVFLDLNMQDLSGLKTKLAGFEVLSRIKSKAPSIYVVIRTGYKDVVLMEEAQLRGADKIMVKGDYTTAALFDVLSEAGFYTTVLNESFDQGQSQESTYTTSAVNKTEQTSMLRRRSDFGKWIAARTEGILDELLGSALIALFLYAIGKLSGLLQGLPRDWIDRKESIAFIVGGVILIIVVVGAFGLWQKRRRKK